MIKNDFKWKLGIIATIIMGIIPLFFTEIIPQKREVIFTENYVSEIFSIKDDSLKSKLEISYLNKSLDNLYTTEFKMQNRGKEPITKYDFEEPLKIIFDSLVRIYDFKITDINPNNINFNVKVDSNSILIDPLLLNPKDEITFKILLSNYSEIPIIDARISGIKEISFNEEEDYPFIFKIWWWGIGFLTLSISVHLFVILYYNRYRKWCTLSRLQLTIVILLCWICGLMILEIGSRHYDFKPSWIYRIIAFGLYFYLIGLLTIKNLKRKKTTANTR